jgi:hypothetical protein
MTAKLITTAVHPRMRGEHLPLAVLAGAPNGSSPHARGVIDRRNGATDDRRNGASLKR